MAVLKANAYGLGVLPVAETVRAAGAACFGVAEINEAIELAPLGLPVQILGNLLPDEIAPAVEYGIVCPLNDLGMAKEISAEAVRQNRARPRSGHGRLRHGTARHAGRRRGAGDPGDARAAEP